ncbi:hypothetical protein C2S51_032099 [Perilla frutescens var. frutescens]|nr:hypothetical protein C2S51_032099 [Perilla frutescens var. frutescens]
MQELQARKWLYDQNKTPKFSLAEAKVNRFGACQLGEELRGSRTEALIKVNWEKSSEKAELKLQLKLSCKSPELKVKAGEEIPNWIIPELKLEAAEELPTGQKRSGRDSKARSRYDPGTEAARVCINTEPLKASSQARPDSGQGGATSGWRDPSTARRGHRRGATALPIRGPTSSKLKHHKLRKVPTEKKFISEPVNQLAVEESSQSQASQFKLSKDHLLGSIHGVFKVDNRFKTVFLKIERDLKSCKDAPKVSASSWDRLRSISNESFALGEAINNEKLVRKVLKSLLKKFAYKVAVIEEDKDIKSIRLDELMGSLRTLEINLENEDSSSRNRVLITKNFNRMLKRANKQSSRKFNNRRQLSGNTLQERDSNNDQKEYQQPNSRRGTQCRECDEFGHIQVECANILKRNKNNYNVSLSDDDSKERIRTQMKKLLHSQPKFLNFKIHSSMKKKLIQIMKISAKKNL